MSQSSLSVPPLAAPALSIPHATATVEVRIIDTQCLLRLSPKFFWQPSLDGFDGLDAPVYCFLITHNDTHIVFDLGVRTDWENYPPKIVSLIKATTHITPGKDVAQILDESSVVSSENIEAVIWSHNHFDHIGNIATLPNAELIVGPGVLGTLFPGWPENPDSPVVDSEVRGRSAREIVFDGKLKIGRFDAVDLFEDGSFFLLDAPGHALGHMCALARTTPNSFVFMGADACHHPGVLRPTKYLSLPESVPASLQGCCPGDVLQRLASSGLNPCSPIFTVADGPLFPDRKAAMETVEKIHELDACEEVFVILGHDNSLRSRIPMFPEMINDWKERDLCSQTRWCFYEDFINVRFS
jgi:glyoxylase-like metal-dependent hydrolase (beta-lactamase superfamily II)